MASEKNLQELFHETLKDIYFAEKKILGALPEMAEAAQSQELKAAFELHETETEERSHGSRRCSKKSTRRRARRPATPSWASSRKVKR
jgi:ferritin-like metal-binding protein YciE